MNKQEKNYYMNKPSIGYYSGFNGIEIKDIEYSIDDYVIYIDNAWYNHDNSKVHKSKIYYNFKGESFFRYNNCRIYFHDVLRMNL